MDDLEQFRYKEQQPPVGPQRNGTTRNPTKIKSTSAFIRGPIPLDWLARAAKIPRCNALVVGLVLFYLAGLTKERDGLVLTIRRCKPFGLERKSVNRGLADLEKSGLIRVTRKVGRSPRVDILSA
jgi:hypothetical protein